MTYVISDLHGYPIEKFEMLLEKANFGEDDFLYILGDVIDRNGDGGVGILRWLLSRHNVQLVLGNHEAMLLACAFLFDEITDESIASFDSEKIEILSNYQLNGGDVTLKSLAKLNKESAESVADILDYLRDAPIYEAVTAGKKDYLLLHSGLGNFCKTRKISDYVPDEILWNRPKLTDEYFDGITAVFGHTPTFTYGEEYRNKIIKTKTWINIDMGASDGITEPVLLRLDDMAEFRNSTAKN